MFNIIAITSEHVGLHDVNQRRLFNWQEIADSPVATQCDLNTLKDMQAHAAKVEFKLTSVSGKLYIDNFREKLSSARDEVEQRASVSTFPAIFTDVTIYVSRRILIALKFIKF